MTGSDPHVAGQTPLFRFECKMREFPLAFGRSAWFCMHSLSAASPITPSPTSSLRVSEELREAILSGEFGPGERLRTESLAKRFGSSRTPVREALVQLEGEGLVDIEPRRGALVRSFASSDLIDLYEIRALLEPAAAARAALRVREDQLDRLGALVALSDARGGGRAPTGAMRCILKQLKNEIRNNSLRHQKT